MSRSLSRQMAAGRLRRTDPVLALPALAGPIMLHLLTRPVVEGTGAEVPVEQAVDHLVQAWLRAMEPGRAGTRRGSDPGTD